MLGSVFVGGLLLVARLDMSEGSRRFMSRPSVVHVLESYLYEVVSK